MTLHVLAYVLGHGIATGLVTFFLYFTPEVAAFHPAHTWQRFLVTLLAARVLTIVALGL